MATLALNIDRIEDALADHGYVTEYTGDDDCTSYRITGGSRELEILDGVDGGFFKPENVTEAILYASVPVDATETMAEVRSEDEFILAVANIFGSRVPE